MRRASTGTSPGGTLSVSAASSAASVASPPSYQPRERRRVPGARHLGDAALSRALLAKGEMGPQLIAGVTGVVSGVVLLLIA